MADEKRVETLNDEELEGASGGKRIVVDTGVDARLDAEARVRGTAQDASDADGPSACFL